MKESARRSLMGWALILIAVALGGAAMVEWKEKPFKVGSNLGWPKEKDVAQDPVPEGEDGEPEGDLKSPVVPPKPPKPVRTNVERWVVGIHDTADYVEAVFGYSPEEQRLMTPSSADEKGILRAPDGREIRVIIAEGSGGLVGIFTIDQAEILRQKLARSSSIGVDPAESFVVQPGAKKAFGAGLEMEMRTQPDEFTIDFELKTENGEESPSNVEATIWDGQTVAYIFRPEGSEEMALYLIEATLGTNSLEP